MMKNKFTERLKELRHENSLLQSELANIMQLRSSTISGWEVGRNQPDYDTLILLSEVLDVSVDYLIGKTDF